MRIIDYVNGKPIMQNKSGLVWTPFEKDGRFGLGSFCVNGKQAVGLSECFLQEELLGQRFFCQRFEELENSESRGVLRFSGYDGRISLSVCAVMEAASSAVSFDFEIEPVMPINHRVYAKIPLSVACMDFVKFPFEDTLTPEGSKAVDYRTSFANAPFAFGCANGVYIGAGYHLSCQFEKGQISFVPEDENAPLRIYNTDEWMLRTVDMQLSWRNDLLRELDYDAELAKTVRRFKLIVSAGTSQFDCVKGYIDCCGYDKRAEMKYNIDDICDSLFDSIKRASYVEGKGYTSLIRTDTGKMDNCVARGGYGKLIPTGLHMQLALELYRRYRLHPEDEWAKHRAFEMADFCCANQLPNGVIMVYDSDTGAVDMSNPDAVMASYTAGYLIMLMNHSIGAANLLKLYQLVKADGEDIERWRDSAIKAISLTAAMISEKGELGRNYNFAGQYDKICPAVSDSLLSLEYLYEMSGDANINSARERLESYTWETFIKRNSWMNDSFDGGNWDGNDAVVNNNDSMNISTFISYCAVMHKRTKEQKYLDMAKHALSYLWLISVPVQMKGFKHFTRGLQKEQDFYINFDIPFKAQDTAIGYPYLAMAANEPFFMEFYGIMLQTEMDLQEKDDPFKMIHLGLECDTREKRPLDVFGEGKQAFFIASSIFVNSVREELSYAYVGGRGWGKGRDYYLPFDPKDCENLPYVTCSSSMLREQRLTEDGRMRYALYDREHNEATVQIKWNCGKGIAKASVYCCGISVPASELYDSQTETLTIHAKGDGSPTKLIFISFGD